MHNEVENLGWYIEQNKELNSNLGSKYIIIITGKDELSTAVGTIFHVELTVPFQKGVIPSKGGKTCLVTSRGWEAEKWPDCDPWHREEERVQKPKGRASSKKWPLTQSLPDPQSWTNRNEVLSRHPH